MIPSINLDNQNTADIFETMLGRMQQYYGTEQDISYQDPGVALLELFSLLKDMQQFYMNYVDDAHRLAYIRLFGLTCRKAVPAQTLLAFHADTPCVIPKGFVVKAAEIPFETTRELVLSVNRIAALVLSQSETLSFVQEEEAFYPFGKPACVGNALLIGFEHSIQSEEQFYIDMDTPQTPIPLGKLQVEALTAGGTWEAVPFTDGTDCLKSRGYIHIVVSVSMQSQSLAAGQPPLFWVRLVLTENSFLLAPRLTGIRLNTVLALQQETITQDMELGRTNGTPNQQLRCPPCEILKLEIHTESGVEEWTRVESFSRSGALDRHFRVEGETIVFGNDEHGASAPTGRIHLLKRRMTLGAGGNVPKGMVNDACQAGLCVQNIRAASGGCDAASIDETLEEVRRDTHSMAKAVTLEDYRHLVKAMPSLAIDEVKASIEDSAVVLYVKPKSDLPLPVLNEAYRNELRAYLEPFRMLTAQIRLESPTYWGVTVMAELVVSGREVHPEAQVIAQLHTLLPEAEHANVFCDSLSYGELYGLLVHLPFVRRVNRLVFECGGRQIRSGFFPVGAGGILYLKETKLMWIFH